MNSLRSLYFLIFLALAFALVFLISGVSGIYDFFSTTRVSCKDNFTLPSNAYWVSDCHWSCNLGFQKNLQATQCTELPLSERERIEVYQALGAQNASDEYLATRDVDVPPSSLVSDASIFIVGKSYSHDSIKTACSLGLPSEDQLSGYFLPLMLSCDGVEAVSVNNQCLGVQMPVNEPDLLLNGNIECVDYELDSFFSWCEYSFTEMGLSGRVSCSPPKPKIFIDQQ